MKLHLKQLSHYFFAILCLLVEPCKSFAEENNSGGHEVAFAAITCYNLNYCCDYWGDLGKCAANEFVKYSCPATCKKCVRNVPKSRAADYFPKANCQHWTDAGLCISNPPWMSENCRFSCGLGNVPREAYCAPDPPEFECLNDSPCCEKWYRENEGICESNDTIKKKCRATCKGCKKSSYSGCFQAHGIMDSVCEQKQKNGECKSEWMRENCRFACGLCNVDKEAHCVNPKHPCEEAVADYYVCMRKNYGDIVFNSKQQIPFDDHKCKLKECLNECRPPLTECSEQKATAADSRLEGSVNIGSQSIALNDIPNSKRKALDCALNTVRTVLIPKIEQCVRKELRMYSAFHLHQLSLEELLNTDQEYDALEIAAKLYDLQRLVFDLIDEAGEICPNNKSKTASECIFKRIVNILVEVGNPAIRAYRERQLFCESEAKCKNRLSAKCNEFKNKIAKVTASCTLKLTRRLKQQVITEYLQCLGQKKGFPPAIAGLQKDPSERKQLSKFFDESVETLSVNLNESSQDPCTAKLFNSIGWDTVVYFNLKSKHTMVCSRTPKLTREELQSGRLKRQISSPIIDAQKDDMCRSGNEEIAVPQPNSEWPTEFLNTNKRSINEADAARSDVEYIGPLTEVIAKTAFKPTFRDNGGSKTNATITTISPKKPVFQGKG